jgi:hypothetical protein
MRKLWLVLLPGTFIFFLMSSSQEKNAPVAALPVEVEEEYPKDYFRSPIDEEIRVSGTFGELRPDHFHAGLDIKSNTGRIGQPVYAAAAGFIDRIKVQANGYGNALYVKHPNGYTTLYGHLDRFAPDITAFVREMQYKKQRFDVDLHPPESMFRVAKGAEIAKMGNSGGSTGPHLHFEIRKNATHKVLNPLLFGMPVHDNVAPEIRDMKVYFLDEQRGILGSKPFPVGRRKNGTFALDGDTVRIGAWRVGFGVKAYDGTSGYHNDNGIYALEMYADDNLVYEWQMDALEFEESRFVNAHVDYEAMERFGAWFHRCFVMPGDHLSNYTRTVSMGSIPLYAEKPVKIGVRVKDASGNESTIVFWALRDGSNMEIFQEEPHQYELPYDSDSRIDLEDFSMLMPKGALYENLHFQYAVLENGYKGACSPVFRLQDYRTPLHRYMTIRIKAPAIPSDLRPKAVIAKCGNGRPENCGVEWQGDFIITKIREFGDYCVMIDTQPPSIIPVVFDKDMRRKSTISFRIADNFSIGGLADGMYYSGAVDGKWVLFEYDKKRNRLTYTFDEHVKPGEHWLKLTVKDDRDNAAVFERKFIR